MMAFVEPHLILELAVLYAVAPWIMRLTYPTGTFVVGALTIGIGVVIHVLVARDLPQPPHALARYIVLALLVFAALVGYFGLRAKALSPAITESRLQALQARIRPHFLFNSINAVLSLVRKDPKHAENALLDMADLFRVLMRDNRELVPLNDEIELCQQYLALEKLRLSDRLQVDWHLNSMPSDALVPPLFLQPLLENAVYHGIEPSSTPGVISINIFYRSGEVHAILRNPYQSDGGNHHAGNKMAVGNIRERLRLHFDAEASLEARVRDSLYEVHIRMPYRAIRDARKQGAETAPRGERADGERRGPDTRAGAEGPRTIAGGSAGASRG
jgi:two-component system sensor histidine kinase AlgZ